MSCYYVRPGAADAQLALVNVAVAGAHADGGFVEIDAADMPGWYRFDISDAMVAAGVISVGIILKGAADMAANLIEIQLTGVLEIRIPRIPATYNTLQIY